MDDRPNGVLNDGRQLTCRLAWARLGSVARWVTRQEDAKQRWPGSSYIVGRRARCLIQPAAGGQTDGVDGVCDGCSRGHGQQPAAQQPAGRGQRGRLGAPGRGITPFAEARAEASRRYSTAAATITHLVASVTQRQLGRRTQRPRRGTRGRPP